MVQTYSAPQRSQETDGCSVLGAGRWVTCQIWSKCLTSKQPVLDISYKRNHPIWFFCLVCLVSFTRYKVLNGHNYVACVSTWFFSWLHNTLLYTYQILFIHSSVEGHLGCFYFLIFLNNASMNIHVYIFVSTFSFLLAIYVGIALLGHMWTLYLWEGARVLSKAAAPCTFPPATYEGSNFFANTYFPL